MKYSKCILLYLQVQSDYLHILYRKLYTINITQNYCSKYRQIYWHFNTISKQLFEDLVSKYIFNNLILFLFNHVDSMVVWLR